MRRLVAISNKKSKALAALVAVVLSLTSIHLAASARMATLKREQERLEQAAISIQKSAFSRSASTFTPLSLPQSDLVSARQFGSVTTIQQENAAAESPAMSPASPAHKRQIVISIPDRQLALLDNGQVLKIYPIAVGTRSTPSPDGDFVIVNHAKDPTYRHGDKEIEPGKDNPLGSRWMGLNLKGYGIHGTNLQSSIGKASSHGCFRMRKRDVEELYSLVRIGDTVTVRRERDAMIAQLFAAPGATPAVATNAVAVKAQGNGEVQVASAAEKTTVETTQQ
jgi:lipoprotein-anchoring transpeptidase ErfK/SrfK